MHEIEFTKTTVTMDPEGRSNSTSVNLFSQTGIVFFIQVMAVIGNLLVLLTFAAFKSLQKTQNAFSINMAISDIQAGLFTIKTLDTLAVFQFETFPGCEFLVCYQIVIMLASALSVLCSALDRFVALRYPLRYTTIVTLRKTLAIIGLIWFIALIIGLGPLYGLFTEKDNKRSKLIKFCSGNVVTTTSFYGFVVLGVLLPVAFIVCSVYLYISKIAKRHECQRAGHTVGLPYSQHLQKASRISKSARLFVLICMIMVICLLPYAIAILVHKQYGDQRVSTAFITTSTFAVLPHALNPWIYTLRNAEFREATKKLFQKSYRKVRDCLQRNSVRVKPEMESGSGSVLSPPQHPL